MDIGAFGKKSRYYYRISVSIFLLASFGFATFAHCDKPKKRREESPDTFSCRKVLSAHAGVDLIAMNARLVAGELQMENIRKHLEVLTGENPPFIYHLLNDRYSMANKELVRMYLMQELAAMGWGVKLEPFKKGLNFYVEIPGTLNPEEVLEVTAHYDTAHSDVPGADDNGSGLGVLLELARIFKVHPPGKTLRIVFMDLEEQGFHGSLFHSQQIVREFYKNKTTEKSSRRKFLGSLVIDTIGYSPKDSDSPEMLVLEIGEPDDYRPGYSSDDDFLSAMPGKTAQALTLQCAQDVCFQFLRFANLEGKRQGMKLSVDVKTAKPETGDHGSYWKASIPAMFLAAPYEDDYVNPKYHTSDDKIRYMNWDYYSKTAAVAVETVAALIQPDVRLIDDARSQHLLAGQIAAENKAVLRTDDLVERLETKPKVRESMFDRPSYQSPSYSSWSSSSSSSSSSNDGNIGYQTGQVRNFLREEAGIHTVTFIYESNGKLGDVVNDEGGGVWVSNSNVTPLAVRMVREKGCTVLKKIKDGLVLNTDKNVVAAWLKARKESGLGASAPPPEGFTIVVEEKEKSERKPVVDSADIDGKAAPKEPKKAKSEVKDARDFLVD